MGFLSDFVESAFFNTDNRTYWQPHHFGLNAKSFKAISKDGNSISGLILEPLKSTSQVRTLFYFNPAQFNAQFNLGQVAFLCEAGFQVLLFDYSGSGQSTGRTSIDSLLNDAEAAWTWFENSQYHSKTVVLFGQAVGADAALQFYAKHSESVAGLVLESVYCHRKGWIRDRWGPVVGDIAALQLNVKSAEPADILPTIRKPLVIVCPEKDSFVHSSEKNAVFELTPKSAEMWHVPNAKFLSVFPGKDTPWQKRFLKFLQKKCFNF